MTPDFVAKRTKACASSYGTRAASGLAWCVWSTVLLALSLGACSSSRRQGTGGDDDRESPSVSSEALTYYRDAKPILDQKCGLCHYEGGLGPYPFTTYEEIQPHLAIIKLDVEQEIMPPWRAAGEHGLFEGDRRLTDEQKETLLGWIEQGAIEGDPEQEPEPLEQGQRSLPRVDESLEQPEGFTPDQDPDTYRCFLYEWPHETRKFVTGMSVEPERVDLVHHGVVYLVAPDAVAGMRARDEAGEGPGFDCYNAIGLGAWLTSYEPGGYGQTFGGGLGMQIEPGSLILVQVHYNTINKKKGPDRTRLDLILEDEVERVGRTTLIVNPFWVIPQRSTMLIPANEPDVRHYWAGVPRELQGSPQDIYAVDLHMHTLGSSGSIGIVRAGSGTPEVLLDIPRWAFEWQETYRFTDPVRLEPGDQLFVECHFDNTAEKQIVVDGKRLAPRDVRWGENTTDEMCLGNVLTTPAL